MFKLVGRSPSLGKRLLIVAAFPPPIGGAAKNTQIIHDELVALGVSVEKLSTSVDGLSHARSLRYHAKRLKRNLIVLIQSFRMYGGGAKFYTVPDGGLGAYYTFLHVALANLFRVPQVVHHRTFKYIEKNSFPVRAFTRLSRSSAMHVFLSDGMAKRYIEKYGEVKYLVASNARFAMSNSDDADDTAHGPRVNRALRLGHLSNLCRDKGFYEVVETFRLALAEGIDVTLDIAGPVLELEVQKTLDEILTKYPSRVRYWGSVTGRDKTNLYKAIDVFVFPTQFDQEAQPNVVYEALAAGVKVVTVDRGCIREMVPDFAGKVFNRYDDFANSSLKYLKDFDHSEEYKTIMAKRLAEHMSREAEKSSFAYSDLYRFIIES